MNQAVGNKEKNPEMAQDTDGKSKKKRSSIWTKEKNIVIGYSRLARMGSALHGGISHESVETDEDTDNVLDAKGSRYLPQALSTKFFYEDDSYVSAMELPADFTILPIYNEIMEEPLPPMEIFPAYKTKDPEDIESVIIKMDGRIRKNPSYKAFLEEVKNLLIYVLQEVKMRKTLKGLLNVRDNETKALQEYQRRDPRLLKVISLADHWRKSKEESEEKAQVLLQEIQNLTGEAKLLENKLVSMQKKQDKLEVQLNKCKHTEHEKDRLEEKLMAKEKAAIDIADQMEQLDETMRQMTASAAAKEAEFKAKLESAPDRNAFKIAALTRELESMTLEKENKVLDIKELQGQVNSLVVENSRSSDRIRLIMSSLKTLQQQWKSLELRHRIVVSQNKGLVRQIEAHMISTQLSSQDFINAEVENNTLKEKVSALAVELKSEKSRCEASLRRISSLELQKKSLQDELAARKAEIENLVKIVEQKKQMNAKCERKLNQERTSHHRELENMMGLEKKLVNSVRHLRIAHNTVYVINEEMDRAGDALRALRNDLRHCQEDNQRHNSTITHLHQMLETTENMVRLQVNENDALVMSKNRIVDSLRSCLSNKKTLQNEVSRIHSVKTALEDVAFTHKFMLDFVESERDGALRTQKLTEDYVVILQRKQVVKIAQLARVNGQNSRLLLQMEDLSRQLNVQKREVQSLSKDLKFVEGVLAQTEQAYRLILSQRDMFGTRILQQNNEMAMTQLKMSKLMKALDTGNTCYRDRCSDIAVLKKEIQRLRKRIGTLEQFESLNRELRTEVTFLNRGITVEMNRRAAIERCKMPKVHRFREIESKDPSVYEMILKIQAIQKTLIRKTQECIEKEKEITIRNDRIVTLEKAVRRRSDNKVDQKVVKAMLERKNQTIKALTAELNMLKFYLTDDRKLSENERQELATAKIRSNMFRRSKSASRSNESSINSSKTSFTTVTCTRPPVRNLPAALRAKPSVVSQASSLRLNSKLNVTPSKSNHS